MLKGKVSRFLMDRITAALIAHRDAFLSAAREQLPRLDTGDQAQAEQTFRGLNQLLFSAVQTDVIQAVREAYPGADTRLEEALRNPSLVSSGAAAGMPFSAEHVYSICFWAVTGSQASGRKQLAVKQLQSLAIQDAMQQLSAELSANQYS